MKNAYLILLLCVVSEGYSQFTLIPDTNFEQVIINMGYDSGVPDGSVPTSNITSIGYLDCSNMNITSLSGIEDFSSLTILQCSNNLLTDIDLSQNANLKGLRCEDNLLTSINVTQNAQLNHIFADGNELSTLDVSQNAQLGTLSCQQNQLSSIDLTHNTDLEYFYANDNQFSSLDLTHNTQLKKLYLDDNLLSELDLSLNTLVSTVRLGNNQLTSLDLKQNSELSSLWCANNQLTSLDLSYNMELHFLESDSNQLTSIDFGLNGGVSQISCEYNQLTNLNLALDSHLTVLECSYNQLTHLNLSQNVWLHSVFCSNNNLECLDITNGHNTDLHTLNALNNPNLLCIEVDDTTYADTTWSNGVDSVASFSTNCNQNCVISNVSEMAQDNSVVIYPNPTSGAFSINFENWRIFNNGRLRITNSFGQIVYEAAINQNNTQMHLNSFGAQGLYFVHVFDEKNSTISVAKLILQ